MTDSDNQMQPSDVAAFRESGLLEQFDILAKGREIILGAVSSEDIFVEDLGEWEEKLQLEGGAVAENAGLDRQMILAVMPGEEKLRVVSGFDVSAYVASLDTEVLGIRVGVVKAESPEQLTDLRIRYGLKDGRTSMLQILEWLRESWLGASEDAIDLDKIAKIVSTGQAGSIFGLSDEATEIFKQKLQEKADIWGKDVKYLWQITMLGQKTSDEMLAMTKTGEDCNALGFVHFKQIWQIAKKFPNRMDVQEPFVRYVVDGGIGVKAIEELAKYLSALDPKTLQEKLATQSGVTAGEVEQFFAEKKPEPKPRKQVPKKYTVEEEETLERLARAEARLQAEGKGRWSSEERDEQSVAAAIEARIQELRKTPEHADLEELVVSDNKTNRSLDLNATLIDLRSYLNGEADTFNAPELPPEGSVALRKMKQELASFSGVKQAHPERFAVVQRWLNPNAFKADKEEPKE